MTDNRSSSHTLAYNYLILKTLYIDKNNNLGKDAIIINIKDVYFIVHP